MAGEFYMPYKREVPDWVQDIVLADGTIVPIKDKKGQWRDFITGRQLTSDMEIDPLPPYVRAAKVFFEQNPDSYVVTFPQGKSPRHRTMGPTGSRPEEDKGKVIQMSPRQPKRNRRLGS